MKQLLLLSLAWVLLSGCAPIPQRPDLPSYSATALQTAVLVDRMFYIMLPEQQK
jgi:hypothetical protein